jgi:hypothetical protein
VQSGSREEPEVHWATEWGDLLVDSKVMVQRTYDELVTDCWWGALAISLGVGPAELLVDQIAALRLEEGLKVERPVELVQVNSSTFKDLHSWTSSPRAPVWSDIDPAFGMPLLYAARRAHKLPEVARALLVGEQVEQMLRLPHATFLAWAGQRLPQPSCRRWGRAPDVAAWVVRQTVKEQGGLWKGGGSHVTLARLEQRCLAMELLAGQSPLWEQVGKLRA